MRWICRWLSSCLAVPRNKDHQQFSCMNARHCVKFLKSEQDTLSIEFDQAVERLEIITEHPDISGYLSRSDWRNMRTKRILKEIMSEVALIESLVQPRSDRIR